jgi:hypothetical protein
MPQQSYQLYKILTYKDLLFQTYIKSVKDFYTGVKKLDTTVKIFDTFILADPFQNIMFFIYICSK